MHVGDMNLGLIQPGAGWNKNATTQPTLAARLLKKESKVFTLAAHMTY